MGTNLPRKLRGALLALALLAFGQPERSLATTCTGADVAVTSVVVKAMSSNGRLNRYRLLAKVVNLGKVAQPSNTLQFVDIYKGRAKQDSRGIPPLKPGQSYTFEYVATRSAQAGSQTTALAFRMNVRSPRGAQDCNTGNGITMVRF
jgi:hypothetical protein